MKTYIGTKTVKARPMTRLAYNQYRGWDLPANENGDDPGMLTEDPAGKPNMSDRAGYVQWLPLDEFERTFREEGGKTITGDAVGLDFGAALAVLKAGGKVARAGWNGKGMWIALSPGSKALPPERFWATPNRRYAEENGPTDVLPCITMKTATGEILMGWLASQTDMLAEDWMALDVEVPAGG